jgi:hypothetical protein
MILVKAFWDFPHPLDGEMRRFNQLGELLKTLKSRHHFSCWQQAYGSK